MNYRKVALSTLLALVLPFAWCGCLLESEGYCGPCSLVTPNWPRPNLDEARDTVVVDQRRYTVRAYVWRDFMPGEPCMKLTAVVRLFEIDSLQIPSGTVMDHIWIRHGSSLWSAQFTSEDRPDYPPHMMERVARCGPKWPTDELVDVVVRVRFGNHVEALLRQNGVLLERTD